MAMGLLVSLSGFYFSLTSFKPQWSPRRRRGTKLSKINRAEFLGRSGSRSPQKNLWKSSKSSPVYTKSSPVKGVVTPSRSSATDSDNYYSTFHKTPDKKKFSEEEWKDFTDQSTRHPVAELASSPKFTDWIVENAGGLQLRSERSSDESIGSGSYATPEDIAASSRSRGQVGPSRDGPFQHTRIQVEPSKYRAEEKLDWPKDLSVWKILST